jgi:hypothetical protein
MAIDGGQRGQLVPGTQLKARFKGTEYGAEVIEAEDGATRYRTDDGREFKSLSAAGTAVMGGSACNGWRFWSIAEAAAEQKPSTGSSGRRAAR